MMERSYTETLQWRHLRYVRWTDDQDDIPRGTVSWEGRLLFGYPRIGRILNLRVGLSEQFGDAFWVEEKVDGFNVRIARLGPDIVAFTRGGFLCPFTTDRLPDLMPMDIFAKMPDLVICAEVAGPESPYAEASPPYVQEDVGLFVFDMMRLGQPGFLPQQQVYELADAFGLPMVERLGRWHASDSEHIAGMLARLDAEGKEGAVFKAVDASRRIKYTTAHASLEDIGVAAPQLNDFSADYYIQRILRLALFLDEQGKKVDAALERQLGAAFLEGLEASIEQLRAHGRVFHRYRCRFRTERAAREMMDHLVRLSGKRVNVRIHGLECDGGYWRLSFERQPAVMTGLLSHLLKGGELFD